MSSQAGETLSKLSTKELRTLARSLHVLEKNTMARAPQNDDELHAWIVKNLGVNIPRESICENHVAPFVFLSDMYFERVTSAIAMANRGGSKTFLAAMWHFLNSKFKPNCESCSVGAIEQQALRAYENLKKLILMDGKIDVPDRHPEIASSIMRETRFKNGSRVEVLAGTMSAVNGPHPQKVHFDEVELADPNVFQESRNMSQSRHGIAAQDLITSTRKRAHGPMQSLVDEVAEAERQGMEPPYKLYTWCVFECSERQENCQVAHPDHASPCSCDHVAKGAWDDGRPRTFRDVCAGRMARSNGWIPIADVHKVFRTVSQDVWEAQQECTKPSLSGLVLPMFARERHCIRHWDPDPALGPVYMGVDFGGSNPHAVEWYQVLDHDVDAYGYHQHKGETPVKRLKQGTRVAFDEIYKAEIGNMVLADMVAQHEEAWRIKHPRFRVDRRFVDVQAKAARLDWMNHDPALVTQSFATKNVMDEVNIVKELVQDDMFMVDATKCPMLIDEIEAWHYPYIRGIHVDKPEQPVSDYDHAVAATRYAMANIRLLDFHRNKGVGAKPAAGEKGFDPSRTSHTGVGPAKYLPLERRHA